MDLGAKQATKKRLETRDQLWPDSPALVFDLGPKGLGYARVPRIVPMAARLINEIGGAENAGSLYQVLWAQDWGQGIVEVRSAAGLLYEAGYSGKGTRVQRTWLERMKILKGLGFVRTAPRGLEEHGFILLIDPSWAVIKLEAGLSDEHKASFDTWMVQFRIVCRQWGIDLESYKAKLAEVKQGGVS